MTTHTLKIWPQYFDAVASGRKTVELRRDDRGYAVGDTLVLQEWKPIDGASVWRGTALGGDLTGREVCVTITDITRGEQWLQPGVVALSIRGPRAEAVERLYEVERQLLHYKSLDEDTYNGLAVEADEIVERIETMEAKGE